MENKPLEPHTRPAAHGACEARLPHESLHAWQVARELVAFVAERRSRLRGLPGELAGHIDRSAVSAAMNIAEAAGRISPKDRKSRFAIARGEASELAAAFDLAALLGAIEAGELERVRGLALRLTQMLSRLAG